MTDLDWQCRWLGLALLESTLLSVSAGCVLGDAGREVAAQERSLRLRLASATEGVAASSASVRERPASGRVTGGYVMTHEHPTYGMAFGGNYAFAGAAGNYQHGIMEEGYTEPCGGCAALSTCDHGEAKGNFTAALGTLGRDMGNHKSEMGPLHDSNSHLRYSTAWIREAFDPPQPLFQDTRMKIMVAYAVENEAMCEQLYYENRGGGGAGGGGYACSRGDSVASLERQLENLKRWALANASWMEIAYSAADARQIVNANKLAIVLGIEAEYAFGAEDRTFDVLNRLYRYYDQGVRTFYLAHKLNSRLSGADIYYPKTSELGKAVRAVQAISGCFYYDDNVSAFPLIRSGHHYCRNHGSCGLNAFKGEKPFDECSAKLSDISELNMADYVFYGGGAFNGFNLYPRPPGFSGMGGSYMDGSIERNRLALSQDGERVVREAMRLGMIVNLDHVSSAARSAIYQIAHEEFDDYPLNAFHNNPNEMLVGSTDTPHPHEYDFDKSERDYIRRTGGIFGVRLGPLDAKGYSASGVTRNCPGTSTETAKILASLLDEGLSLGYSLDFATVTQGVHSRTFEGCGAELGEDRIHQFGSHTTEGLSHIGVMKKWHRELEDIGLEKRYLDKLKNDGAESFLQMWERSEARRGIRRGG